MDFTAKYLTPDIKLSHYEDKFFKSDMLFEEHMLVWYVSGTTKIVQTNSIEVFGPGDIFLIPRHCMATVINYPKDGLAHQSVVMHLTPTFLKNFYAGLGIPQQQFRNNTIKRFDSHPLLESCMASLLPYFGLKDDFPENLANLKLTEAVSILRATDPDIDLILNNFDEPGKVDLAGFMEKNFIFNMPLEQFGCLTGRSLTTFKRDFKRIFGTTPQRWLTQKRLEYAHKLLSESPRKPVDFYLEIGFENLSHFSYAFKKHFGYAPTSSQLR